MSEVSEIYKVGDRTAELVFRAADITNLADLQKVLDQVEVALKQAREKALREAYQNLRTFAPQHEHNTGLGYESGYHTAMNRILDLITKDAE